MERDNYADRPADSPLLNHETYIQKSLDGYDLVLCSKCRKLLWAEPVVLRNIHKVFYQLQHMIEHEDKLRGKQQIPCPGMWLNIWETDLHLWAVEQLEKPDVQINEVKWDADA